MSGSVFKRCTKCGRRVEARTCGNCGSSSYNWGFRAYVGKDADGDWIERFRSGFDTKDEADRALTKLKTSLRDGTFVSATSMTLGQYLTEEWLPATKPPQVKFETWNDRERNLRSHVVARIGGVELQELNVVHLNRLYADLLEDGRLEGAGGLSPTSVRRIHAMLRKALNDAVRWGLLERNPAVTADPPPARVVKAARRRNMQTWTGDEVRCFLDSTRDDDRHALWVLAVSTGMRRSELLGLRWSDLDLDAKTVSVRQTIVKTEDGYEPRVDQKSQSSARTIHLDRRSVAAMRMHRRRQQRRKEDAGPLWQEHDLVFDRGDGRWWNPPAVTNAFLRAVRRADVPRIRLHDLRHSHASLLLRAGVNPKVVSERLGHSSVSFTLDTYAHIMPGMQPEAAERFMEMVYDDEQDVERGWESSR